MKYIADFTPTYCIHIFSSIGNYLCHQVIGINKLYFVLMLSRRLAKYSFNFNIFSTGKEMRYDINMIISYVLS